MIAKNTVVLLLLSIWFLFVDSEHRNWSNNRARMIFRSMTNSVNERQLGKNCVPCEFHLDSCCEPDLCIKRIFSSVCFQVNPQGQRK